MKKSIALLVFFASALFGLWLVKINPGQVVIPEGASISTAATILTDAKIIRHPWVLRLGLKIFGNDKIFPGKILVEKNCGWRCVVKELTTPSTRSARLTFVEGADLRDYGKILEKNGVAQNDWRAVAGAPAVSGTKRQNFCADFSFLCAVPAGISYEGYLFPDTYDIGANQTAPEIARAMFKNFSARLLPWAENEARARGRTLPEVITLASILEKEVRGDVERKMVADILWRRLDKGMGLQVDSSVQYITAKEGRFTTAADRAVASPWNTYKYRGLPVGPIANPGEEAVRAALNPTPNKYWFYLTSPEGKVYYAATLAEHNANKKYLK